MRPARIVDVRLFQVEGEGSAQDWEDRSARALDLYPEHVGASEDAWITSPHISAIYLEILTDQGVSGHYGPSTRARRSSSPPICGAAGRRRRTRHRAGARRAAPSAPPRPRGSVRHRGQRRGQRVVDLRGKARGDPVYRLLGGPTRDKVPAYASMLGFSVEPERAAAAAPEYQRRGFTAQKWFFKYGPSAGSEGMQRNLSMARAVREAVGPGYRLMFDAFMGWDSTYAADMVRGLEAVEPFWLEEPLPPERVAAFRRLTASSRVRLATGEHAHTRWPGQGAPRPGEDRRPTRADVRRLRTREHRPRSGA
jgi:L-rhamnonate dehydratase